MTHHWTACGQHLTLMFDPDRTWHDAPLAHLKVFLSLDETNLCMSRPSNQPTSNMLIYKISWPWIHCESVQHHDLLLFIGIVASLVVFDGGCKFRTVRGACVAAGSGAAPAVEASATAPVPGAAASWHSFSPLGSCETRHATWDSNR